MAASVDGATRPRAGARRAMRLRPGGYREGHTSNPNPNPNPNWQRTEGVALVVDLTETSILRWGAKHRDDRRFAIDLCHAQTNRGAGRLYSVYM